MTATEFNNFDHEGRSAPSRSFLRAALPDLFLCQRVLAPQTLVARVHRDPPRHQLPLAGDWIQSIASPAITSEEYFSGGPKIEQDGLRWSIDPGRRAFAPVFYTGTRDQVAAIASNPAALAALIDARIDPVALYQWLAFGFLIGERTMFENVKRLCAGERIEGSPNAIAVVHRPVSERDTPSASELIDRLGGRVARAYRDSCAVELTGGVDSRLALALGLSAGARPSLAFTIGTSEHADVRAAAAIAERYQIIHRVEPAIRGWNSLEQDAEDFVRASGYQSNAVEYAWLPAIFRELESVRDVQVTGGGGEAAHGFYDSPLDVLLRAKFLGRLWIKLRLQKPGMSAVQLFRHAHRRVVRRYATDDVVAALGEVGGDVRTRTAKLYVEQRLRTWAAPVLCASRRWYRVVAPFMSDEYLDWAAALPPKDRHGRTAQRALMRTACPELESLPFASAYETRERSIVPGVLRKLHRRLACKSQAPQLHRLVASRLAQDPMISCEIGRLPERCDALDAEAIQHRLATAAEDPSGVGFLVTAAFAERARRLFTEAWDQDDKLQGLVK